MPFIELASDTTRLTLLPEVGGRIHQIEILDGAAWLPLLLAPEDLATYAEQPLLWGCYPMTPWPGRIDGSHFTWNGVDHQLPANDGPHSIHGRGVYLPWDVVDTNDTACVLALKVDDADGWPFPATLRHLISVDANEIVHTLCVENSGDFPSPAGVGWHPWFRRDIRPGADPRVLVDARDHYTARPDLIPTGEVAPPSGDADLTSGPPLGDRALDDFYGRVAQPMTIRWDDLVLDMTSSENCRHAVVYTASRRGFCVEPQTCAPDAFNLAHGTSGTGVVELTPGQELVATTRWKWRFEPNS